MKLIRLTLYDTLRALGSLRWLAVAPVFFVAGWLSAENAQYDFTTDRLRQSNFWDAPLTMMTDPNTVAFAFVFGFVLVTGDLYVRDRSSGAAAMTMLRSRSRPGWWAAKVLALAPQSLVYSILAFLSALAAGAAKLPVSFQWSQAALISWDSNKAIYPGAGTLPPPLFLLLVALYTALALWAVGAVVLTVSTLYPRHVTPLVMGFLWTLAGTSLLAPLVSREGIGKLDPVYQLTYVIHFSNPPYFIAMPWYVSFLVIGATLLLVLFFGALKLRRVDL